MNEHSPGFYSHFVGRGRETLIEELHVADPFRLTPEEVIDRVLCLCRSRQASPPQREEFLECGQVSEVWRGSRWFLVQICPEREMIAVQELRRAPLGSTKLDAAM